MGDYTVVTQLGSGEFACQLTNIYDRRELSSDGVTYFYSGLKSSCIDCPEIPEIDAVPGITTIDNLYGWNASAYSARAYAGDCYTQFSVPSAIGVVCGLAPERLSNDPRDVNHAFYCYKNAGKEYWVVQERGVNQTSPVVRTPDADVFRIERVGELVTYFVNDARVHTSTLASSGEQHVVACLYSAGDGVN